MSNATKFMEARETFLKAVAEFYGVELNNLTQVVIDPVSTEIILKEDD